MPRLYKKCQITWCENVIAEFNLRGAVSLLQRGIDTDYTPKGGADVPLGQFLILNY